MGKREAKIIHFNNLEEQAVIIVHGKSRRELPWPKNNRKISLLVSMLNIEIKKTLIMCYIGSLHCMAHKSIN